MSVVAAIRRMLEAGLSIDQALLAAEACEAEMLPKRSKGAVRTERWRAKKASQSVTCDAGDECDAPLDKDAPHTPQEINPPCSAPKGASLTPRAALETVLDAERAAAVVDHRRKIGKPLTPHAAQLLAAKMAKCPDPNFAADEMVSNGWQGFKPEWLETRSQPPRQSHSPPSGDFNAILDTLQGKSSNDAHPGSTIDGSVSRADSGGAANLVQLHAISARR